MPAKIIIYILSYNTETYNISRSIYGQYKWARFVILPPTILFENYMYDEWLINNYDEWKDCDYIGTLAWKAIKKIKLPDINKLADFLEKNNNFDVVPFYVIDDREYLDYVDIRQPNNKIILNILFNELKYPKDYIKNNFIEFYCNYWIAKSNIMLEYINFFKKCKNIINTNEEVQKYIWAYIEYRSEVEEDVLNKIFGKKSYSSHPFVYERIPYLYFNKYNILHPVISYENGLYNETLEDYKPPKWPFFAIWQSFNFYNNFSSDFKKININHKIKSFKETEMRKILFL